MRSPSWRRSRTTPTCVERAGNRVACSYLWNCATMRRDAGGPHGRPRCAREPRSGANNRGTLPPDRSGGTLPRQAAANQVEVFLAGRLEAQPSRASPAPMGAPASCATVSRTTAGTHPRAQAKRPKEAPAAVAPCLGSPELPSSPTRGDAPRDRRPPNHAASAAFASAQRIEKLLARHDVTLDCFKDLTLHRRAPTGQSGGEVHLLRYREPQPDIWPSESCRPSPCGWRLERPGPGSREEWREAIHAAI